MRTLTLLTTDHCALCEQALDLLLRMPHLAGWKLQVIDIVDDDDLLARYGERIPVLRSADRELAAPITEAALIAFLASL